MFLTAFLYCSLFGLAEYLAARLAASEYFCLAFEAKFVNASLPEAGSSSTLKSSGRLLKNLPLSISAFLAYSPSRFTAGFNVSPKDVS